MISGKYIFQKKVAMYLKHLINTPIPQKVNQSYNKTIKQNEEVKQYFLDNKKTFKIYPLNKQ